MQSAGRQPPLRQLRGGHRAGRHQYGEPARENAFDQREHGDEFADAGPMQPHKRASRPLSARPAVALGNTIGVLLPARKPPREQPRRQRSPGFGGDPVGGKSYRHGFSRERHDDPCGRQSRKRGQ